MKKLYKTIFVLYLAIIPIASFAFKPAPSYITNCQAIQQRLTYIFHESVENYNKDNKAFLDAESPTLTTEEAIKFLKEYGYTDDRLYKVT